MCTVSYIVQGTDKYFTSNRDENKKRTSSTMPQTILRNGMKITFPRDPQAGGSWFAVANNGTIGILLNGAFEKHIPVYPYQKSRGLLLLDMIAEHQVHQFFEQSDLSRIEPFTIILFSNDQLYEFRWDSSRKFSKQLAGDKNHIWSSATLYDAAAMKKREELFQNFTATCRYLNSELIHNFHSNNHGDNQNGFIINRDNGVQTQSITQAFVQEELIIFSYHDIISKVQQQQLIQLKKRSTNSEQV